MMTSSRIDNRPHRQVERFADTDGDKKFRLPVVFQFTPVFKLVCQPLTQFGHAGVEVYMV
jgi:hypothetical protein